MNNMTRKFLAAGLLASALTLVGCKSDTSAEQDGTTQGTTDQGMTTTPAEDTDTGTPPGTGGAGTDDVGKTRQSDDDLRTPYEDPLLTPEDESVREAESESEPGVHDDDPGTGGAGFETEATDDDFLEDDDILNEGGNPGDYTRIPDSPADTVPEDASNTLHESQIPEGTR